MKHCWFCYKECGEHDYHATCARKFFGSEVVPILLLDKELLKDLAAKTINKRIAVTGVQPKLSVTLQDNKSNGRLTVVGLWGEYILKPQHERYAQMPEAEDLTMHLAEVFKIPVCKHTLIRSSDGNMVYLAKRFDRDNGEKIHVEDLCQISEFLTENKYKGSYEKTGRLIAKYCTNTGLDTLNYFELILFSYLSGNNDMHLKNFSLVHTVSGGVALSPAYDLLNVNLVNPRDEEELALTLNGKKRRIKLSDFELLANALAIPHKAYSNSLKKFSSKNKQVTELIANSFLHEDARKEYLRIWLKKQMIFAQG